MRGRTGRDAGQRRVLQQQQQQQAAAAASSSSSSSHRIACVATWQVCAGPPPNSWPNLAILNRNSVRTPSLPSPYSLGTQHKASGKPHTHTRDLGALFWPQGNAFGHRAQPPQASSRRNPESSHHHLVSPAATGASPPLPIHTCARMLPAHLQHRHIASILGLFSYEYLPYFFAPTHFCMHMFRQR
jgi:hypothetical protein